MDQSLTVPAGESAVFVFRSPYSIGQCVSVRVQNVGTQPLTVLGISIAGVEQLLGEGLPAEFLATMPLQLDRQLAKDELHVTLANAGAVDATAVVTVEFIPVEAMTLGTGRLH